MSYKWRFTHVTLPVGVHVRRAPLFGPHRRVPAVLEWRREIAKAVGHDRGRVAIVVVAVARSVAATAVRVAVGLLLERPPLIRVHRHGTAVVWMDRLFRSVFCLWCRTFVAVSGPGSTKSRSRRCHRLRPSFCPVANRWKHYFSLYSGLFSQLLVNEMPSSAR